MMPTQRYTLRDDDVAFIDEALEIADQRLQERHLHSTVHPPVTIDDLRQARLRNTRIRRALRLKED